MTHLAACILWNRLCVGLISTSPPVHTLNDDSCACVRACMCVCVCKVAVCCEHTTYLGLCRSRTTQMGLPPPSTTPALPILTTCGSLCSSSCQWWNSWWARSSHLRHAMSTSRNSVTPDSLPSRSTASALSVLP